MPPEVYPTPPVVTPLTDNLKGGATTDEYLLTPEDQSASGFTGRFRLSNPGTGATFATRTDTGTVTIALPAQATERQKATTGVAYDGKYTAKGTVLARADGPLLAGGPDRPVNFTVTLKGRRNPGDPFTTFGSVVVVGDLSSTGGGTKTFTIVGNNAWPSWAVHGATEWRLEITSGGAAGRREINTWTEVRWVQQTGGSSPTNVSALRSGQKGLVLVSPVDQ